MANTAFKAEHGLFVQGNANVAGNLNVTGDFNVGGTFTSAVQATGDIKPATDGLALGNTTFRWNLFGINVSGRDLSITNSASVSNTLTVTGATTLQSDLIVDGSVLVVNSSSNRVGINVSNPTTALDVSGTIKATTLEGGLNWSNVTSKPSPTITVSLTGDVAGSANASLDALASNTITITTTIQANSVALGTDTTGDYVASVSGGTPTTATASGLNISGTGEGAGVTIAHSDTSTLANTSYSGGTVLNGFTVDTFGHMQTFTSINLDSRYVTTSSSFDTSGTITAASPLTVKAQGTEGGEIVLKKGTGQTALNGDAIIDTLATSIRFFENGGTFRQFNFDLNTGNITNPSGSVIWHAGNDGPGSGLDADSVDGYAPGNASSNIPINNGTLNTSLNADFLDGEHGSYYSNATNLSTGTVPNARLSGTYGNALTLSNSGNVLAGNGNSLTNLNASQLLSGTVPSARLDTSYTSIVNITASGTIQANALEAVAGISTGTTGATGTSRLFINSPAGQTAHPVRILINSGDIFTISPTGAVSASGSVSATSFSGNGASITSINATNISTGTVNTGRLGTGTASSSTFLRGDGTWATPPATDISTSSNSTVVLVNSSTGTDASISGATTSTAGVMTATDKSKLDSLPSTNVMYYAGFTLDASTMPTNSTGFTYSANAPYTGPVARFGTGGSYDLWLNAPYTGGNALAFRTRNGDSGTMNPWYGILLDINNSSLNSDSRNTRGVTRLYRRDNDSDYSLQTSWSEDKTGYWSLRGYVGDTYHAGVWVASAGTADNTVSISGAVGNAYTWTNTQSIRASSSVGTNGRSGNLELITPGNSTEAATMTFHRAGYYAINMGLDSDNVFRLGGWSDGTNTYRLAVSSSTLSAHRYGGLSVTGSSYGSIRVDGTKGGYAGIYYADAAGSVGGMFDTSGNGGDWDPTTSWHFYWNRANQCLGVGGSTTAAGYSLYVNGNSYSSGFIRSGADIYTDVNYGYGLVGLYSASRYQAVFSMGNSYKPAADGTTLSNMYGIAWSHPNTGGETKAGLSHQALFVAAGVTQTAVGTGIWTIGNVTAYSDARVKNNVEVITDAVSKVNQIRGVTFTRTDLDDKTTRHAGVIAQEVEKVLPEVVSEDCNGFKSVAYGNIVGLLIEAVKELNQKIELLEQRLSR